VCCSSGSGFCGCRWFSPSAPKQIPARAFVRSSSAAVFLPLQAFSSASGFFNLTSVLVPLVLHFDFLSVPSACRRRLLKDFPVLASVVTIGQKLVRSCKSISHQPDFVS
jgi:hypothetical protein